MSTLEMTQDDFQTGQTVLIQTVCIDNETSHHMCVVCLLMLTVHSRYPGNLRGSQTQRGFREEAGLNMEPEVER